MFLKELKGLRKQDIHETFKETGVRKWEVAELLGITDVTFSKKLRKELSSGEKEKIFKAIEVVKSKMNAKEV